MGLFFNVRKPRKFRHEPIFWDPEKEALDKRINKVKREIGDVPEEEYDVEQMRGSIIEQTSHVKRRQENEHKSTTSRNIILGVILVLLMVAFYHFYIR